MPSTRSALALCILATACADPAHPSLATRAFDADVAVCGQYLDVVKAGLDTCYGR